MKFTLPLFPILMICTTPALADSNAETLARKYVQNVQGLLDFHFEWASEIAETRSEAEILFELESTQIDSPHSVHRSLSERDQLLYQLAQTIYLFPAKRESIRQKIEEIKLRLTQAAESRIKDDPHFHLPKLKEDLLIENYHLRRILPKLMHRELFEDIVRRFSSDGESLPEKLTLWLVEEETHYLSVEIPWLAAEIQPRLHPVPLRIDEEPSPLYLSSSDILEYVRHRHLRLKERRSINLQIWAHERKLEALNSQPRFYDHLLREASRLTRLFLEERYTQGLREQVWDILYHYTAPSGALQFQNKRLNRQWHDKSTAFIQEYIVEWREKLLISALRKESGIASKSNYRQYEDQIHEFLDPINRDNVIALFRGEDVAQIKAPRRARKITEHIERVAKTYSEALHFHPEVENFKYQSWNESLKRATHIAFRRYLLDTVYRYHEGIETPQEAFSQFQKDATEWLYQDEMTSQADYAKAIFLNPIEASRIRPKDAVATLKTRYREATALYENQYPDPSNYQSAQSYLEARADFFSKNPGVKPLLRPNRYELSTIFLRIPPLLSYRSENRRLEVQEELTKAASYLIPEHPKDSFNLTIENPRQLLKDPRSQFVSNRVRYIWIEAKRIARTTNREDIEMLKRERLTQSLFFLPSREEHLIHQQEFITYSIALILSEQPELLELEEQIIQNIENTLRDFQKALIERPQILESHKITPNQMAINAYRDITSKTYGDSLEPTQGSPAEQVSKQLLLFTRFQVKELYDFNVSYFVESKLAKLIQTRADLISFETSDQNYVFQFKKPYANVLEDLREYFEDELVVQSGQSGQSGQPNQPDQSKTAITLSKESIEDLSFAFRNAPSLFSKDLIGRFKRERSIIDKEQGILLTTLTQLQPDQVLPLDESDESKLMQKSLIVLAQNQQDFIWQNHIMRDLVEFGYEIELNIGGPNTTSTHPIIRSSQIEASNVPDSHPAYSWSTRTKILDRAQDFETLKVLRAKSSYLFEAEPTGTSPLSNFLFERGNFAPIVDSESEKRRKLQLLKQYEAQLTKSLFDLRL